jgi:hypothetical protein
MAEWLEEQLEFVRAVFESLTDILENGIFHPTT